MSHRRELLHHRRQLTDVRQIIGAMQSLAFIQVRRLRRFIDIQQQVVAGLYRAAGDAVSFHSALLPEPAALTPLFLVIGSERGFCGDFNETLVYRLHQRLSEPGGKEAGIVACGRKLCDRLQGHPQLLAACDGAAVPDEVDNTLTRLANGLAELSAGERALTLIYHSESQAGVAERPLLPPFEELRGRPPDFPYPPHLNVPPRQLLQELAEQYLFAALHETLYQSLLAENHRRMQHLEGAVRHLDQRLEGLKYQENQLRQEEIIEEIEVILLNVDNEGLPSTDQ